jgi:hypothetical protein
MGLWNVRLYRPGDEAGINDLFNAVFERRRPLAAWHWPPRPNTVAADDAIRAADRTDDTVVGAPPVVPRRLELGGRTPLAMLTRKHRGLPA